MVKLCPTCRKRKPNKGYKVCKHCIEIALKSHRRTRAERLANGVCVRCGNQPEPPYQTCRACLQYHRNHANARRARLMKKGICTRCENRLADATKRMCEKCAAKERTRTNAKRAKLKQLVLSSYCDPPACQCCGEKLMAFLTMDHINGDGNSHRNEVNASSLYYWLKKNNYPAGYQVLCFNCNLGKSQNNNVCPHRSPHLNGILNSFID